MKTFSKLLKWTLSSAFVTLKRHSIRVYSSITANMSTGSPHQVEDPSMEERYKASMVLSGVGDALGYKNGSWEFCHSGADIRKELKDLGGLSKLKVDKKDFMVSDDTVLHLATAEALIRVEKENKSGKGTWKLPDLYNLLEEEYRKGMKDMIGRAPGACTTNSLHQLKMDKARGYKTIPFNSRAGGCGAAMRSMCIGLRYPRPEEIDHLIAVSVESGRMTHNHPTGYLGSFAGALFTAYAIQGKPTREWGHGLMNTLVLVKEYVKKEGRDVAENLQNWDYFESRWREYLEDRQMTNEAADPVFPEKYGVRERDAYYKSLSFSGWGGSSGHDAPMIAYDALLGTGKDWEELCNRSMFHSGDSDSTGVMAAAWYGAMYGYEGVHKNLYKNLEYRSRLEDAGSNLLRLSQRLPPENAQGLPPENPQDSAELKRSEMPPESQSLGTRDLEYRDRLEKVAIELYSLAHSVPDKTTAKSKDTAKTEENVANYKDCDKTTDNTKSKENVTAEENCDKSTDNVQPETDSKSKSKELENKKDTSSDQRNNPTSQDSRL